MKSLGRLIAHAVHRPNDLAIWTKASGPISYLELLTAIRSFQLHLYKHQAQPGDHLLIATRNQFEQVVAWLGGVFSGCIVVAIEPWLNPEEITSALRTLKPRFWVGPNKAGIWLKWHGLQQSTQVSCDFTRSREDALPEIRSVSLDQFASITFSSGSSGHSKGIIRTRSGIDRLIQVLTQDHQHDLFSGPDLAIFPGICLLHLVSGRGSIYLGYNFEDNWDPEVSALSPETASLNPRILSSIKNHAHLLPDLKKIYIGAAPIDLQEMENIFAIWPHTEFTHIYGCSEVEPIAVIDARIATSYAKDLGLAQLLIHGKPIPELEYRLTPSQALEVRGPHVSSYRYTFNRISKDLELEQLDWLNTGDYFLHDPTNHTMLFTGRSESSVQTYKKEQEIYKIIKSSNAFISDNGLILFSPQKPTPEENQQLKSLGIKHHVATDVIKDRRHQSKIDRQLSIRQTSFLKRWSTYLKERSAPFLLLLIASGPTYFAAKMTHSSFWSIESFISVTFICLSLILMRLQDEYKDWSRDIIAHPERPLPRGLIKKDEVQFMQKALLVCLLAIGSIGAILSDFKVFFACAGVALWIHLMRVEFLAKDFLDDHSILNTLLHQLVVLLMYAIPFFLFKADQTLGLLTVGLYTSATLGASLLYEVARKSGEKIHPAAQSYLREWGFKSCSVAMILFFSLTTASIALLTDSNTIVFIICIVVGCVLCLETLRHKYSSLTELMSVLFNLTILWLALFI